MHTGGQSGHQPPGGKDAFATLETLDVLTHGLAQDEDVTAAHQATGLP
jgi:hypothetical protein